VRKAVLSIVTAINHDAHDVLGIVLCLKDSGLVPHSALMDGTERSNFKKKKVHVLSPKKIKGNLLIFLCANEGIHVVPFCHHLIVVLPFFLLVDKPFVRVEPVLVNAVVETEASIAVLGNNKKITGTTT
jgi:hypothetical protein